jgi:hypothetical protein
MARSPNDRLRQELTSFHELWPGGYYEGDPLDPAGASNYGRLGYLSILHAVYLVCIRPYITPETIALEIGPGRGAWTKTMLNAKEVWCLDAKPRESNGIDAYLGSPRNVVYHQVQDFACRELPDNTFDFLFSFGAFCHISWDGTVQYMTNLYSKLRSSANAFVMIADYEHHNRVRENEHRYDVVSRIRKGGRLWRLQRRLRGLEHEPSLTFLGPDEDMEPSPGRWYHTGTDRMAALLRDLGYVVVQPDVGLVPRDAIVHFRKP